MITTFLWMLYLAFTIALTIWIAIVVRDEVRRAAIYKTEDSIVFLWILIVALLWSIWYFYYLH